MPCVKECYESWHLHKPGTECHICDPCDLDPAYPYQQGDVVVLGPEIFASADGSVISWKGTNYIPQDKET